MARQIQRSISLPIREGLSWDELWMGSDKGLIWCWERGRQYQSEVPERTARALEGELVLDAWRGGVEMTLKDPKKKKAGTLQYLATWQGMRGEDLNIDLEEGRIIICSRFQQAVFFSAALADEEE